MAENKVLEINYGTVAVEPLTLSDAKAYARIDTTADDTVITSMIKAARHMLEVYTNVGFARREVVAVIDNSNGNSELPLGIHGDIVSVVNEAGDSVTIATKGNQYITLISPMSDYLVITYEAGYETLPEVFLNALKAQVAWMYEHRGDVLERELCPQAKAYLAPYRRVFNEFFL